MKMQFIKIKKSKINLSLLTLIGVGLMASCTTKPAVVDAPKTNSVERLAMGKTIYDNSCGKCHDLPNPTDHSAQDWVGIMNWMAPKANLTAEQHEMAYDYVVSVKK